MFDSVIARISDDADDFKPIIRRLCGQQIGLFDLKHRTSYALADRVSFGKKLLYERLVYERQMSGTIDFGIVEDPSGEERNAERFKFLRAHQSQNRIGSRQRRFAANFDLGVKSSERWEPRRRHRRGGYAGHIIDRPPNRLIRIKSSLPVRVRSLWGYSYQIKNMVWIKSQRRMSQSEKSFRCRPCACHQQ